MGWGGGGEEGGQWSGGRLARRDSSAQGRAGGRQAGSQTPDVASAGLLTGKLLSAPFGVAPLSSSVSKDVANLVLVVFTRGSSVCCVLLFFPVPASVVSFSSNSEDPSSPSLSRPRARPTLTRGGQDRKHPRFVVA